MTSKPSQKFATFRAVLTELENSGHPRSSLWIKAGSDEPGQWDYTKPIAVIGGDSRTLAFKGSDGAWYTTSGYDIPNAPGGSTPSVIPNGSVYFLPDIMDTLALYYP